MPLRHSLICSLLLAALAHPAAAETLWKSTMPDGRVIYGDRPAPGAVKSEEQKVDTSTTGVAPPTARESKVLKQMEADRKKREAAGSRLQSAEKALSDAEAVRERGREPLEGERLGTVGGGTNRKGGPGGGGVVAGDNSRLSDAYWERQKTLEKNVEDARRYLEQVRSGK
jgi:hypothetical protein